MVWRVREEKAASDLPWCALAEWRGMGMAYKHAADGGMAACLRLSHEMSQEEWGKADAER